MIATLKLLNSYFWKTIYGPILAFVFPLILLGILGNILRLEYIYPGLIALAMMFLGIIALPLSIMELKGSSLFKYIGSSPVNPLKFTLVVISFYAFIAICTGVVIFLGTMAIFSHKSFPSDGFSNGVLGGIFTLKGAFSFYIGCAIHLLFVIIAGIVISTFARTPQQCLTIGLMVVLPSMFLSGMVLSVDIIGESTVMNWISRFIPFRYSTANLIISATPRNQLGAGINYSLNRAFDQDHDVNSIVRSYPNNNFDQLVWPYKNLTDTSVKASIIKLYPEYFPGDTAIKSSTGNWIVNSPKLDAYLLTLPHKGVGFEAWRDSMFSDDIFSSTITYKVADPTGYSRTLYNLLKPSWDSMNLNSDNNIFNWTENWGVRKIPSVDTLQSFVTNFFKGVDDNGVPGDGKKIGERVVSIGDQIGKGNFGWLELFIYQSNTLYFIADRILNILLPLLLSGLGAWYIFKNFSWSAR